jgi:hypothetical protein
MLVQVQVLAAKEYLPPHVRTYPTRLTTTTIVTMAIKFAKDTAPLRYLVDLTVLLNSNGNGGLSN